MKAPKSQRFQAWQYQATTSLDPRFLRAWIQGHRQPGSKVPASLTCREDLSEQVLDRLLVGRVVEVAHEEDPAAAVTGWEGQLRLVDVADHKDLGLGCECVICNRCSFLDVTQRGNPAQVVHSCNQPPL